MIKKILITGISGFLGSAILRNLDLNKYEIHGILRKKVNTQKFKQHIINLSDHRGVNKLINKVKPDYLIHLAWVSEHNVYWNSINNISSLNDSINLYESFCETNGKKILLAGTCDEYAASKYKCKEDLSLISPSNLYSSSKNLLNMYVKKRFDENNIPYNWLRIFYPSGKGEKKERLIPYIINEIKSKRVPTLNNSDFVKDLIHVEDCASIIIKLLKKNFNGNINIGMGKPISLKEICELIINEIGYGQVNYKYNENSTNDKKKFIVADQFKLKKYLDHNYKYSHKKIITEYCSQI
jgi:nucleoside-diphosphate-sugar epimerase